MEGVLSFEQYQMLVSIVPIALLLVIISISLQIINSLIYYTIIKRLCKCCFTRSCIKFFKKCPKCTVIRNGVKDVMIRVSNFLLFELVVQEGNKECEENDQDDHLEESSAREDTATDIENGSHDEPVDDENGSHDEPVDDETNDQQENTFTLVHEYQEYTQIKLGTSMGRKKEKKKLLYYLYGVQVHYRLIQFLFVVSLSIIGMSFVLFWNIFIAEEIYGCDNEYDCFVWQTDNINYTTEELITNCTDFKNNNNNAVAICYKLVFNFSEGIGAAGGFLFAMQVLVNLLIYITIRVRKMKCNNACCRLTVKFAVLITIFILQLAFTLVAPIVIDRSVPVQKTIQTLQSYLQGLTYMYTSIILLLVVPFVAIGTKNSKTNEQKS